MKEVTRDIIIIVGDSHVIISQNLVISNTANAQMERIISNYKEFYGKYNNQFIHVKIFNLNGIDTLEEFQIP